MKRNVVHFDVDGNATEGVPWDCDWDEIRAMRKGLIEILDGWYLKDRWDALSSTNKGKLNTIRQTLRDLPQTYDNANDAFDNFPEPEEWMMKG